MLLNIEHIQQKVIVVHPLMTYLIMNFELILDAINKKTINSLFVEIHQYKHCFPSR